MDGSFQPIAMFEILIRGTFIFSPSKASYCLPLLFPFPWGWGTLTGLVLFPAQPPKDWHGSSKRPHTTNCSSSGKRRFGAPRTAECNKDFFTAHSLIWFYDDVIPKKHCALLCMVLTLVLEFFWIPKQSDLRSKSWLWRRDWSEKVIMEFCPFEHKIHPNI